MKNELSFKAKNGSKYRLRLADIHVKVDAWVEIVDVNGGEAQEAIHVNITDEDQQDFRDGAGFDEFLSKNPELETVITEILRKATDKLA
jgi:hypothetical protein